MTIIRATKIAVVFSIAATFLFIFINNIFDYGSNFSYVQHVLTMDSVFPENTLLGRAIHTEWVHHLAYWGIIVTEGAVSFLCIIGGTQLLRRARSESASFNSAKGLAALGLTLGFFLMVFGFMAIGGEWFMMWQSEKWGMGLNSAFRVSTICGLAYLILLQPDT
ncbi:MAG: DUF2165 domain-containing protein [Bdellovibrionia bacterium]